MGKFLLSMLALILIRPGLSIVKDKAIGNSLFFDEDKAGVNLSYVKGRLNETVKNLALYLSPVLDKHEFFLIDTERGVFDDVKIDGFGTLRNGANPRMREVDNQCVSILVPLTMPNMTLNVGTIAIDGARGDGRFAVRDNFFEVDIEVIFHYNTCLDSRIARVRWLRLFDVEPELPNCLNFQRDGLSTFFNTDVRKKLNKHFNQQSVLYKLTKTLGFCKKLFEA